MLDSRLSSVERDISLKKGKIVFKGSGIGSLGKMLCGGESDHLEFVPDSECEYWNSLACGEEPKTDVVSFPFGKMQRVCLKTAQICATGELTTSLLLSVMIKEILKTPRSSAKKA